MNATVDLHYVFRRTEFSLDVELKIPMQGITGIFGESGSGKTTLLRCIAGLEQPATGQLSINGDAWQDTTRQISRAIHERQIGYVFQEPRLFRHLNVRRNLEYGQRRRRDSKNGVEFDQIVGLLGLERLIDRTPDELSGGEAQRVAIARALLSAPLLVLMDQPLASAITWSLWIGDAFWPLVKYSLCLWISTCQCWAAMRQARSSRARSRPMTRTTI